MTIAYRLHYAPDNASLIVRLAMEELGVPYETSLVDRSKDGQTAPAYLKLNPNGLIPVLETPHGALFETGAILLWLADTHGSLAPEPTDLHRGPFLKWLFWTSNTLHADLRLLFYPSKYAGTNPVHQEAIRDTVRQRLCTHLGILEDVADKPWLSPATPTVLNFYVACLLRWMALFPKDADRSWFRLAATPRLFDMLSQLEQRASVRAAQAAEGLGETPFTSPIHANPPEGTAI